MTNQNSTPNPRYFFSREQRVRKGVEFQAVYQSKLYAADGVLVLNAARQAKPSSDKPSPSRLGLSVSKKNGNAPKRNQWKRQIRQAFRLYQHKIPAGWDFVVRPKKDAPFCGKSIQKSLPRLIKKVLQKEKIGKSKTRKQQGRSDGK